MQVFWALLPSDEMSEQNLIPGNAVGPALIGVEGCKFQDCLMQASNNMHAKES